MEQQTTFDDLAIFQYVRSLNVTQINVIQLLDQGEYQASIAKRLRRSRSYVNQLVRKLERYGLVIPQRITVQYRGKTSSIATADPLCGRATTYVVTDRLKDLLAQNPNQAGSYTLCIPHHVKFKIPVLAQRGGGIVTDGWRRDRRTRAVHIKSWRPKGPERHLFHVQVPGGTIGVEVHGKTLVAYRTERTHVLAASVDEATQIVAAQIQQGVSTFVADQERQGVLLTIGTPQLIAKPHFAFASAAAKAVVTAGQSLATPGLYCDDSLKDRGPAAPGELETTDPLIADQVDRGLRNALNLGPLVEQAVEQAVANQFSAQNQTLLDEMAARLDPITQTLGSVAASVSTVWAHVQGGTTLQYQFNQLVGLLNNTLIEMQAIRAENQALRDQIAALAASSQAGRKDRRKKT